MKKGKIQEIINNICSGDFSCSDINLLFVWLRPNCDGDEIILDLCNFITHPEGRIKGISFLHVDKFVKNFLEVSERGGTIFGLPDLFIREDIIKRLIHVLQSKNIIFEEKLLSIQKDKIIDYLQELIEEVEFHFQDPRIIRCFLRRFDKKISFCLQADLKGPAIKMSPGASICSNLFN